jgi:hypothetical protein
MKAVSQFPRNLSSVSVFLTLLLALFSCGGGLTLNEQDCPGFEGCLDIPERTERVAAREGEVVLTNIIDDEEERTSLIRLRMESEKKWRVERIPVKSPVYEDSVTLLGLTWAGDSWVGLLDAGQINADWGQVILTRHDPDTFAIKGHNPAPRPLAAITWDGKGFWAADKGDGLILLRLDADFTIVSEHVVQDLNECSDLAWGKDRLWCLGWQGLHVIDVRKGSPRIVGKEDVKVSSPSGIGWDGESLWINDMDSQRLHRSSR